jgi:ElaB/YqjD/DUF883 family membrane-anchored ribosome-binding protein
MSDRAEGAVADTGEAIQRQINRVDDAATQTTDFIRKHPIAAVLIAVAAGYVIGKVA